MTFLKLFRLLLIVLTTTNLVAAEVTVFVGTGQSPHYSAVTNAIDKIYSLKPDPIGDDEIVEIIDEIDRLKAVEYEPNTNKVYFSAGETIYRANPDGSSVEPFRTGHKLGRGLSIDAQNNVMFWTHYDSDSSKWHIRRSALYSEDATAYETIATGLTTVYQLSINTYLQHVFYVEWTSATVKFIDYEGEDAPTTAMTIAGNELNGIHIIGNETGYGAVVNDETDDKMKFFTSASSVFTSDFSGVSIVANGFHHISGGKASEVNDYLLFSVGANLVITFMIDDGGTGGPIGQATLPVSSDYPVVSSPFVDKDADGVPDQIDICEDAADSDTDGDGTLDCQDDCDDDENKTAAGICGCGVSDVDSDEDGTADCNDACPADPDKVTEGERGCGNPELEDIENSLDSYLEDLGDLNDPEDTNGNSALFDSLLESFADVLGIDAISFRKLRRKLRRQKRRAANMTEKAIAEDGTRKQFRRAKKRLRKALKIARRLLTKLKPQS